MSLSVALQSVVFYFIACTPCAKVRHRNKARQQAKKDREEKAQVEALQPGLYRHPSPFNTNPYWEEEIMMGPRLPKKGRSSDAASKNTSQRGLTSAGRDSGGMTTRSSLAISTSGHDPNTTATTLHAADFTAAPPGALTGLESTPTVVHEDEATSPTLSKTASVSTGDDWNLKRYQREDEELWGHELTRTGHKLMDAIKQAGNTAGRFVEARLGKEKQITDEDRYNFYFSPRNPPVNDYHPPVVSSKPAHKDGHRWMLQPPPPAKVMEGKVPVSRSISNVSMASRRTAASGEGTLARLVGEKAVEAKLRKGEVPAGSRARSNSSLSQQAPRSSSAVRPRNQPTARVLGRPADSDESPEENARRRRPRKMQEVMTSQPDTEDDEAEMQTSRKAPSNPLHAAHAAQPPRLSTIPNSDTADQSDLGTCADSDHAQRALPDSGAPLKSTGAVAKAPADTGSSQRAAMSAFP